MKKKPSKALKEKFDLSRDHAIAVLMDRGKILATANQERIPTATLVAMLGITFPGGKSITKGSEDNALLHWHETGFGTYSPPQHYQSSAQKKYSDANLIKTATAETMKNRRLQYYSKLK